MTHITSDGFHYIFIPVIQESKNILEDVMVKKNRYLNPTTNKIFFASVVENPGIYKSKVWLIKVDSSSDIRNFVKHKRTLNNVIPLLYVGQKEGIYQYNTAVIISHQAKGNFIDWMKTGRSKQEWKIALTSIIKLFESLHHNQKMPIYHGNPKPSNILWSKHGHFQFIDFKFGYMDTSRVNLSKTLPWSKLEYVIWDDIENNPKRFRYSDLQTIEKYKRSDIVDNIGHVYDNVLYKGFNKVKKDRLFAIDFHLFIKVLLKRYRSLIPDKIIVYLNATFHKLNYISQQDNKDPGFTLDYAELCSEVLISNIKNL